MKRSPKQKKHLRGEPAKPAKFSRKDLLQIWGIIALIFGIVGGSIAYRISVEKADFAKSLTSTIDEWRTTYHLDDTQARRILEIEFAFHGTGNRLTQPGHGPGDTAAHHAEMAAVMNPADGARFLRDQKHHQPHK